MEWCNNHHQWCGNHLWCLSNNSLIHTWIWWAIHNNNRTSINHHRCQWTTATSCKIYKTCITPTWCKCLQCTLKLTVSRLWEVYSNHKRCKELMEQASNNRCHRCRWWIQGTRIWIWYHSNKVFHKAWHYNNHSNINNNNRLKLLSLRSQSLLLNRNSSH